jgi:primary-amine oxidase
VIAWVDVNARRVVKFVDEGGVPVPSAAAEYSTPATAKPRRGLKPLQISQPQGHSFEVSGHEIRWQNWRFRYALHPREGLVLYTVGYEDEGKVRSILYRASLSELFVPYGDVSTAWHFRNVFDMGGTGLGWLADALEPRSDCPDNAVFFNAALANDAGTPFEITRAVGLYERDGGLLWKHFDFTTNESRRARQLVLMFIATVGNYEYGLSWIFHQDGTLEVEVLLTGIMSTKAVAAKPPAHDRGHQVAPQVEAVHHQHFFNFRLDFDIEEPTGNSVVELNHEVVPADPAFPGRTALAMRETVLASEQQARRELNLASGRKWKVINSSIRNSLKQPVGYALIPGENAVPFVAGGSALGKRAGFMYKHLWATAYDAKQMNAAGYYVQRNDELEGLPAWSNANRPLEDTDVVLWYTLGITHIPRPEEWPVMTGHRAGFKLVPSGFFSRNPALDVPRSGTPAKNKSRP